MVAFVPFKHPSPSFPTLLLYSSPFFASTYHSLSSCRKVAVIVILAIAGVAALAALSVFLFRRYKNRQSGEASFGRGGKFTSFVDEDE
jgi:nitrate reductase gamma subunit